MTDTPLHIALISETFTPPSPGPTSTLARLCAGLSERGHQLQLVRPRQAADRQRSNDAQLVLTHGWPLPWHPSVQWSPDTRQQLLTAWRQQRPDVLYIATEGPLGLAALGAARQLQIPVVSGVHHNLEQYRKQPGWAPFSNLLSHYLRWFHNRSQLTLVPSPNQYLELGRRGFQRLQLLGRGVDSRLFHPRRRSAILRASWGLDEQAIAVLYVGYPSNDNPTELLAPCLHALQRAHPQRRIRLIVSAAHMQRAALQQALPEAVVLETPADDALAEHYASGDVLLLANGDGHGSRVLLEALASGLAVVAFERGAAAQHIRHGHNGALAMSDDLQGFIEAASWLLDDRETLRRIRLNARLHASHQGWESVIQRFEMLLRSACGEYLPT